MHALVPRPPQVKAVVFIDGKQASKQYIKAGSSGVINGFKDRSGSCVAAAARKSEGRALCRLARR
jgi:hypothetical protein